MISSPESGNHPITPKRPRSLVGEMIAVLFGGIVLGLVANWISPKGLSLTRDYFPHQTSVHVVPGKPVQASNTIDSNEAARERLRQKGLKIVELNEVQALAQSPAFQQQQVIFVDARDDIHYQAGHIPGAFQLDRFYLEKYFPILLPAAMSADQIIVYCNGGACEDSEFAAANLKDAGINADKVRIFAGGITEWRKNQLSIEVGERNSGVIAPDSKP